MDRDIRLKRLRFRSWHRGTKEADLMVGGFFDAHGESWSEEQMAWFEAFIEEQDVDIMAWAMGAAPVPERWVGPMMTEMQNITYVPITE